MEKTWVDVVMALIEKLSPLAIVFVIGVSIPIGFGAWAHFSKRLPWKIIHMGTNGSTVITADDLKAKCESMHGPMNTWSASVDHRLTGLICDVSTVKSRQTEVIEGIAEVRGYLKGRFRNG